MLTCCMLFSGTFNTIILIYLYAEPLQNLVKKIPVDDVV